MSTKTETKCEYENVLCDPGGESKTKMKRFGKVDRTGGGIDFRICTNHGYDSLLSWINPEGHFVVAKIDEASCGIPCSDKGYPLIFPDCESNPIDISEILAMKDRGESPEQLKVQIAGLESKLLFTVKHAEELEAELNERSRISTDYQQRSGKLQSLLVKLANNNPHLYDEISDCIFDRDTTPEPDTGVIAVAVRRGREAERADIVRYLSKIGYGMVQSQIIASKHLSTKSEASDEA